MSYVLELETGVFKGIAGVSIEYMKMNRCMDMDKVDGIILRSALGFEIPVLQFSI